MLTVTSQTCDVSSSLIGDVNNPVIADSALTASASFVARTQPQFSRLHTVETSSHYGAWSSGRSTTQWIQADLGQVKVIQSVTTQGRSDFGQFVREYIIYYSMDGSSFQVLRNINGNVERFVGNVDQNSLVTNSFVNAIVARYVRLQPTLWTGWRSLRWELIGCNYG